MLQELGKYKAGQYRDILLVYILLLISAVGYYCLCYQTNRADFGQVFGLFVGLFFCYFIITKKFISYFKLLVCAAIVFRIITLFSVPNLSDDVYRFIWDGRLMENGISPYQHLPSELIHSTPLPGISKELYEQLNSPNYYTIYPPVLQAIFLLSATFSTSIPGAIFCMKAIILLAETGTIILLPFILERVRLPKHLSLLYALNPLVIVELTGNVHFDAVMIFFLVLALLFLLKKMNIISSIFFGLTVSSKLMPVLFTPLIIKKLGKRCGWIYAFVSGTITIALFSVFIRPSAIPHLLNSINLFFSRFEFNASVYYLVRGLGILITGHNLIAFVGPLLSVTAAAIILYISLRDREITEQQFFKKALQIITVYYLFATTVHPWYITMPVVLAVFTPYRFAMLWSFTATLSYAAYHTKPVQENLWLIGGGYLLLLIYGYLELKRDRLAYLVGKNK